MARRHQRHQNSEQRLRGNLCDVGLNRLLSACQNNRFTGTLRISSWGYRGAIQLVSGAIADANFGRLTGSKALEEIQALRDGMYEFVPTLPDVSGALANAGVLEGDLRNTPLSAILQQCSEQTLSCTISVISAHERIELTIRAGELIAATRNGMAEMQIHIADVQSGSVQIRPLPLAIQTGPQPNLDRGPRRKPISQPPPLPIDGPTRRMRRASADLLKQPAPAAAAPIAAPAAPIAPPAAPIAAPAAPIAPPAMAARMPVHGPDSAPTQVFQPPSKPQPAQPAVQHGVVPNPWPMSAHPGYQHAALPWTGQPAGAYMQPTPSMMRVPLMGSRMPAINAAVGVGLLCLTVLVGVVASTL